ncbi:MAG: T9SS type A sorting domain-containing protein [bacterium]
MRNVIKPIATLILGGFGLLFTVFPGQACTVFNKSEDALVLFGNVENEAPQYVAELHFNPPDAVHGKFGHFLIYYNGNVAGGMNDQGLCFDVAGLPEHPAFNGKPYGDLVSYLLEECATLDEALAFFNGYYWPGHGVNHIMIMDKSGASAVVELIESDLFVFYKTGDSQVMTNFSFADPEIRYGEYPCPRYEKATGMLDTMSVSVDHFQQVCEEVSNAYYDALYANIYNPQTLDIYFFNANLPGSERTWFNLVDEMSLGSHHYILKDHEILLDVPEFQQLSYAISANKPNPFTNHTFFTIELKEHAELSICLFDVQGNRLMVLEENRMPPGVYNYNWNPAPFPKGIYFCKIMIDGIVETRKWVKQ